MFEIVPFNRRRNDVLSLFDEFERSIFDSFRDFPTGGFRTDIIDNGDSIVMEAELPGFDKKDIKLELKDGCLTVSAKKDEKNEVKKDNYIRRERRYGSVSRCFDVTGIKEDEITADFKDGVLRVTLPKAENKAANGRLIDIK